MPVYLDPGQSRVVEAKRKATKPQYFDANLSEKVDISEDFEAFLILQGRDRNKKTVDWLKKVKEYSMADSDRDALIAQLLEKDTIDASNAYVEVQPFVRQFDEFRTQFNLTGFETVPECSLLLSDLQRGMGRMKSLGDRWEHRQIWNDQCLFRLKNAGFTGNALKQLNSWFSPLTAY